MNNDDSISQVLGEEVSVLTRDFASDASVGCAEEDLFFNISLVMRFMVLSGSEFVSN